MAGAPMEVDQFVRWAGDAPRRLDALSFEPAFRVIKQLAVSDIKTNFDQGRAPDGAQWAPLRHARPRGGNKPLRDRGLLMASMTAGGQGHVETISAREFSFGSNLVQARTHQYGATIRAKKGKYLAIPVSREAVRFGSPREFTPPLIFIPKKSGRGGVLVEKENKGRLHYVLVEQVVIAARSFAGWSAKLLEKVERVIVEYAAEKFAV
jgi:phage gpG-like protein